MSVFAKAKASRSRYLKSVLSGVAMIGVGAMVLSGCSASPGTSPSTSPTAAGPVQDLTLKIGTLTPETGELAFLGPPQEAGVLLAVKDINAASLGVKIELTLGDSGDPDNKAYATTVPKLLEPEGLRDRRCCGIRCVEAGHRPGHRRGNHPVLPVEHVAGLHHLQG